MSGDASSTGKRAQGNAECSTLKHSVLYLFLLMSDTKAQSDMSKRVRDMPSTVQRALATAQGRGIHIPLTNKMTHRVGRVSKPTISKAKRANTMKTAVLDRSNDLVEVLA